MSTKRILSSVLVASAVLLAVGIGPRFAGTARALPPAQGPEPTGATIPYPGHLTDEAGEPVADGAYAFTFALYDVPDGGTLLWSETQTDVAVQGGAFTALLGSASPLPAAAKDGAFWLAVGVRGPGESEFTLLSPRQQLSAAAPLAPASPAASPACAHDHLGEVWPSTGSYSNSFYALRITNSGTGDGIRIYTNATAYNYAAFYGHNTGAGTGVFGYSSGGRGVYAQSSGGDGIEAVTNAINKSAIYAHSVVTGANGVYGVSSSGRGVYGRSTSGDGVEGNASAAGKSGVYGNNTGSGYGIFGRSSTGFGLGVEGGGDGSGTDLVGDLTLGGARGEVFASGSYLNMYSNGNVNIDLDNDNNGTNFLNVWNGTEVLILELDENGNLTIPGTLTKGGLAFRIDHPLDAENKYLNHSGVESPDMMNIYNGTVTLDANGEAWVELPDWFEALNRDFRYQLTCIGAFAPVYVAQEIEDNRFQIAGGTPGLKVSWQVTGIRHDPYAEAHRIPVEEEKPAEEQGTYLHSVEYGKPEMLRQPVTGDVR